MVGIGVRRAPAPARARARGRACRWKAWLGAGFLGLLLAGSVPTAAAAPAAGAWHHYASLATWKFGCGHPSTQRPWVAPKNGSAFLGTNLTARICSPPSATGPTASQVEVREYAYLGRPVHTGARHTGIELNWTDTGITDGVALGRCPLRYGTSAIDWGYSWENTSGWSAVCSASAYVDLVAWVWAVNASNPSFATAGTVSFTSVGYSVSTACGLSWTNWSNPSYAYRDSFSPYGCQNASSGTPAPLPVSLSGGGLADLSSAGGVVPGYAYLLNVMENVTFTASVFGYTWGHAWLRESPVSPGAPDQDLTWTFV